MPDPANDPFDLQRFVQGQDRGIYERALGEIRAGRKTSHWMWFIFPQLKALGRSHLALHYGVASLGEARAYLAHPVLGPRLRECVAVVAGLKGRTALEVFGTPDDLKLRSSLTLFEQADPAEPLFAAALEALCDGLRDDRTLALLGRPA